MSGEQRIDLNSATAAELMSLPGIGPGLAARIIAFRSDHPIADRADLTTIPGISPRMADELLPLLAFNQELASPPDTPVAAGENPTEATATASEAAPTIEAAVAPSDDRAAVAAAVGVTAASVEELEATESEEPVVGEDPAEGIAPDEDRAASIESDEAPAIQLPEREREREPEPAAPRQAAAPQLAGDLPSLLRLTGCRGTLLALFGGAVFGTFLTLATLAFFNGGSLRFANFDRANDLAGQQEQLEADFMELVDELVTAEAAQGELQSELERAAQAQADLRTTITVMETRVENVAPAAERLDTFILGMREFLNELATPARPTMTPFVTNTPTMTGTSTRTATPAAGATRTPRPTATPFGTATP